MWTSALIQISSQIPLQKWQVDLVQNSLAQLVERGLISLLRVNFPICQMEMSQSIVQG
jgi:acetolactate synthase regulatory subunit